MVARVLFRKTNKNTPKSKTSIQVPSSRSFCDGKRQISFPKALAVGKKFGERSAKKATQLYSQYKKIKTVKCSQYLALGVMKHHRGLSCVFCELSLS